MPTRNGGSSSWFDVASGLADGKPRIARTGSSCFSRPGPYPFEAVAAAELRGLMIEKLKATRDQWQAQAERTTLALAYARAQGGHGGDDWWGELLGIIGHKPNPTAGAV